MDVVHYLDLQHMAHRGPIERGLRYVRCHNRTKQLCSPDPYLIEVFDGTVTEAYDIPTHYASEIVTASYIEYHNWATRSRRADELTNWTDDNMPSYGRELKPTFFTYFYDEFGKMTLQGHSANDAGLWDVPGIEYKNHVNYVLDVNALLRQGIRIGGLKKRF